MLKEELFYLFGILFLGILIFYISNENSTVLVTHNCKNEETCFNVDLV